MLPAIDKFQEFCDPEFAGYLGDVADGAEGKLRAREGWREVLLVKFASITPSILPPVADAAVDAFFAAWDGQTFALFQAGLAAACDIVAAGMLGHDSTPPATPHIPAGTGPTHALMSAQLDGGLTAWLQTGTAINLSTTLSENWS